MKLRNLRLEQQPRIMIIPMIDIIFFLLVFFMMSTLYMHDQQSIAINLPSAATATKEPVDQPLTLLMTADNKLLFNNQEIPPGALSATISMALTVHPNAPFILKADRQIEYGKVITLLDNLKQLGVKKISFATEVKQK
jgi:biopolymer transport protein ExbD